MEAKLLTPNEVKRDESESGAPALRFVCKNCGESFGWEKELSKHRRLDCKKKPFGCPECGQLLSRRDSLRQHLQRHDGGKKYSCEFCEKHFDQQQNLKVHLRIHSGVKPFQCAECGKQFNQSQNLTTHLRVHSGEKPYSCDECGARFRFCSGYKSHISRSHNVAKPRKRYARKTVTEVVTKNGATQNGQVQRVSVIAKASSSSLVSCADDEPVLNCTKSQSSGDVAEKSEAIDPRGSPAGGDLFGSTMVTLNLKYKCRVCHIECFRQLDMLQHIKTHEFAQYQVLKRENVS